MNEAYVINLKRRPDRLAAFHRNVSPLRSFMTIQTFEAIDGRDLDLEDLRPRINKWNFEHMSEQRLRGYIGNVLSHLGVWELAARSRSKMIFVFEDDATLVRKYLSPIVKNVLAFSPMDADLIWMNDYVFPGSMNMMESIYDKMSRRLPFLFGLWSYVRLCAGLGRPSFRKWEAKTLKTTEAYAITPHFAKLLYNNIVNDLGAIDEHIRGCVYKLSARGYVLKQPVFAQADRRDTDIQFGI